MALGNNMLYEHMVLILQIKFAIILSHNSKLDTRNRAGYKLCANSINKYNVNVSYVSTIIFVRHCFTYISEFIISFVSNKLIFDLQPNALPLDQRAQSSKHISFSRILT